MVFTPSPYHNDSVGGGGWEEDLEEILRKEGCFHPDAAFPSQLHHMNDHDSLEIEGVFLPKPVTIRPDDPVRAVCGNFSRDYRQVRCYPEPDAFNPCEDVMGQWVLRATVWVVLLCALCGNLAVLVVIMSARSPMSVSKFLMCHLAFADLCMGLYLLLIASVDARTVGTYFNYALRWQHGPGCQIAGFLTVFASELSIFTLTVITLERWYAITYAIHLNRRLHLGTAAKVMALGWVYAIVMAALPILGISSYARTSICLPMENRTVTDLTYIVCLLSIKGVAFLLICTCYAKMYLSIRVSSNSGNRDTPDLHANRTVRSDLSVAKRMAMLVFTDFACWAPIAFFGLTAVAGHPLIDVTHSKILLVFFYPLNSCCNPFLYAILTKQYRRDVLALLARWGVCPRRGGSCVHGRTLSTNTHQQQRQVSSVKALYRNSTGVANHRQVSALVETPKWKNR
ncbi:hypothetical protein JTE90_006605 [Oedothorax gibbosus]|uniref:G-protein coupled receptors family 1 profile domain-containing protein n=1 Tax=Oedothorax gibbosus TaxID=931172 RepID=A0AAV6U2M1_9ARAC|nr:hypothetical protein JTE90_006605 [Oedothorax gibbosus]